MERINGKRQLSDEDLAEIATSITRPANADAVMFPDVVKNLIRRKMAEIMPAETDPDIKNYLAEQERIIREQLNDVQLKMTPAQRDARNFLSTSTKLLSKYYSEIEIAKHKQDWIDRLNGDIRRIFGSSKNKATQVENDEPREIPDDQIEVIVNMLDYKKYLRQGPYAQINDLVNKFATKLVRDDIRAQLMRVKVKPSRVKELGQRILLRFERALCVNGKMVGNVCASSQGESATQQTLNTFHAAGDRNARKQIVGFAKIHGILNCNQNPSIVTLYIFMRKHYNKEQLYKRTNMFLATSMSDLIKGHRIIPTSTPKPRWEQIWDTMMGIDETNMGPSRFALHRKNPIFSAPPATYNADIPVVGRIIEIELDTAMMFNRKVTMNDVVTAIENTSDDIRVTASSLSVGLIYVYFRFVNLQSLGDGPQDLPEYTRRDSFAFGLEEAVYPQIKNVLVQGVLTIDYVSVQSYKIRAAIMFQRVYIESATKIVNLRFDIDKCAMWALTEDVWTMFIATRLRLYYDNLADLQIVFNKRESTMRFNLRALKYYKYEESKDKKNVLVRVYKEMTMSDLQGILEEEKPLLRIWDIIKTNEIVLNAGVISLPLNMDLVKFFNIEIIELTDELDDFLNATLFDPKAPRDKNRIEVVFNNNNIVITHLEEYIIDPPELYIEQALQLKTLEVLILTDCALKWHYATNAKDCRTIMTMPEVDPYHTRSDHVVEMYRILGGEGCRTIANEEIKNAVDSKIHPVHNDLLADALTYITPGDKPLAQNQYGMIRRGTGTVAKMYERTTHIAMESALGEVDQLNSLTSQIMLGRLNDKSYLPDDLREKIFRTNPAFRFDFPSNANSNNPNFTEYPEGKDLSGFTEIITEDEVPVATAEIDFKKLLKQQNSTAK